MKIDWLKMIGGVSLVLFAWITALDLWEIVFQLLGVILVYKSIKRNNTYEIKTSTTTQASETKTSTNKKYTKIKIKGRLGVVGFFALMFLMLGYKSELHESGYVMEVVLLGMLLSALCLSQTMEYFELIIKGEGI